MMQLGIAKYVLMKEEIEEAKEWCRGCIKLRVEMDSLNADLDEIKYSVTKVRIKDLSGGFKWPFKYRIEARLDI